MKLTLLVSALLFMGCIFGCCGGRNINSPYDVVLGFQKANGDMDFLGLWKELGVKQQFPTDRGPYYIDTFELRDMPEKLRRVLVRIGSQDKDNWEYLFFAQSNGIWKCVGVVDKTSQTYREPSHRVETIGVAGVWCVIRSVSTHGTGVFEETEEWYDMVNIPFRCILLYPVAGRSSFTSTGALFEYFANSTDVDCQHEAVCINYKLSWSHAMEGYSDSLNVISQFTGNATFCLDSSRTFHLLENRSDVSVLSFFRDWMQAVAKKGSRDR